MSQYLFIYVIKGTKPWFPSFFLPNMCGKAFRREKMKTKIKKGMGEKKIEEKRAVGSIIFPLSF